MKPQSVFSAKILKISFFGGTKFSFFKAQKHRIGMCSTQSMICLSAFCGVTSGAMLFAYVPGLNELRYYYNEVPFSKLGRIHGLNPPVSEI